MDRGRALAAVALVLAVLALGTLAGGFSSGTSGGGKQSPGVGIGSGNGSGVGQGSGIGLSAGGGSDSPFPAWVGLAPLMIVLWVSAITAVAYAVHYLWGVTLRQLLRDAVKAVGLVVVLAVAVAVGIAALTALAALLDGGGGGLMGGAADAGTQLGTDAQSTGTSNLVTAIAVLGGVALALLLLVALRPSEDHEASTVAAPGGASGDGAADPPTALRADGDVADPDAVNDVYRAWGELREQVGPRDRSETPEELKRRALEAGYDERTVEELTSLFNVVRYGGDGATGDRERRARDLRAAIEGDRSDAGSEGKKV